MSRQVKVWVGWGLIAVGAVLLYNNFAYPLFSFLAELLQTAIFYEIYYRVPELLVAAAVIVLGIRMLCGSRRKKHQPEEIPPYHAGNEREEL